MINKDFNYGAKRFFKRPQYLMTVQSEKKIGCELSLANLNSNFILVARNKLYEWFVSDFILNISFDGITSRSLVCIRNNFR
jgi:hypothetical protein